MIIEFTAADHTSSLDQAKFKLIELENEFKKAAESYNIHAEQYILKESWRGWTLTITAESPVLDQIAGLLQKVTEPKYFVSKMKDALFYRPVLDPQESQEAQQDFVSCLTQ